MRWNDSRVFWFGYCISLGWMSIGSFISTTNIQFLTVFVTGFGYMIFTNIFSSRVRRELLPDDMTVKQAGYGDREYKYLEDKYND